MASSSIDHKQLLENLNAGVARLKPTQKLNFAYVNPFLTELFGATKTSLNKSSLHQYFSDKRQFKSFLKELTENGEVRKFDTRFKRKSKTFWGTLSAFAVMDKKEKVCYYDMIINDISQRQQVEKELRESKDMFETLFEHTAAAITVTDKNEKIIAWNKFAETLLKREKKDLFNLPVKDLYPDKQWKRLRSLRIREKGILSNIETKIKNGDGNLVDVNVSISIIRDADGKIKGSIGIIHDITHQKEAEKRIRDSENKIRIILDNSAAAIMLTDGLEKIVSWNKFTEELLEMSKRDLYQRNISSIYPEQEWKKIRSANIRKTGSKHHMETKIVTKKGNIIDVDLSVNVLRDTNNEIIGSVGIIQDITKQKRIKEMLVQAKLAAEEASSAKSLFLANMSHEVRTPMNAILGMIDLTLDTKLQEDQRENLLVAKDAADNLLGLLNDILDLSRVEAGKISLESIEFHLQNVAASVVKGLSVMAKSKGLELELVIDKKVPLAVEGDPVRLRQIIINLLNNAIKFQHKGKIVLEIKVASPEKDGEVTLIFSIIDQGIGIPKNRQDKVFEVFTQAEDSTTRRFGGTGLGLAICRRLTEMMGGRIWVESEEGKGSTFSFTSNFKTLDVQRTEVFLNEESGEFEVSDGDKQSLKGLRILLAEDNIVNQKIALKILEKKGWTVLAVDNGQEAVDQVKSEKFDVVLMDAHMPILDGLEATRTIRNNEKETGKHVPIIALTARAMQEDRKKCIDAGMDGYVAKPIDRKKLFEEIESIINKGRNDGQ